MDKYYIQINVVCILVLAVAFFSYKSGRGILTARRIAFNRLILTTVVMCITDIVAWTATGKSYPGARAVVQISNILYDAAITWTCFSWVRYVNFRIRSLDYDYKKRTHIEAIPLFIMLLILVTNPLTNLMFSINENNEYSRGSAVFIHWIISWGYLVYATIEVFLKMHNTTSKVEKRQLLPLLYFIIPPAIGAVVQMLSYGVTSTQCGIVISILMIAIGYLTEEVSEDTLTGLNNRRAFENYVIEQLQRGNSRLTVLMCDVDKFKSINDEYGHSVGDLVLKRIADALKRACSDESKYVFLCRYGGDEFVICSPEFDEEDCRRLEERINNNLSIASKEFADRFPLKISIGRACENCSTLDDVEALVALADSTMYKNKQSKR